ncbi:MAG: hypothetical protein IKJ94_02285 [Oscillospiraceae bacterium]|nr:hypothetical protein [Oscillospiraceae bacterium]
MSGTLLKFLALVCMTVDHVGMVFFPEYIVFRQIGRLAFPIFAYMIAEGCHHTHRMGSYLGKMVLAGAVCQVVYYFFMDSLYQCVLVTFSLAIALIWLLKKAREGSGFWYFLSLCGIGAVYFVTERLAAYLPGTDYAVDYGFFGVMLPVAVYLGRTKGEKLALTAIVLLALVMTTGAIQMYALLTIPLLALYNGKRGKGLGKYFFYVYYPLHLVVIQVVAYFV